jgi:hypothetical protein
MKYTNEELNKAAETITKTVVETAVTETKKGVKTVLYSALVYIAAFGVSAAVSLYGIYYAADWSYDTMCKNEIIKCDQPATN